MEVKATAKTVRIAPRKVRLVLDLVRGKDAKEAVVELMMRVGKGEFDFEF